MASETKFKETEIGMIPEEWNIGELKDFCSKIGSGATPRGGSKVYIDYGIALIRSQNVYDEGFKTEGLTYIQDLDAKKLNSVEVKKNDILFNITGDSICRCCIAPDSILPARVNQHVSIIRTNTKLYYKFLYCYLCLKRTKETLLSFDAGGTRKAITKGNLEKLLLPLPSYTEQTQIGDFIGLISDKIDLNNQMNKTLEQIAQALFKRWFIDFEFPDENGNPYKSSGGRMVDSELGEIPEGWRVGKLGDIANEKRKNVKVENINPETPYFGLEHIPRKSISLSDWGNASEVKSNKLIFEKDDILFGKIRPYFHKVGIAPIKGICSTDIIVISPKKDYYSFVLSIVSSEKFVDYATQTSEGTKMPRANWRTLIRYPVVIPDKQISKRYNETVSVFVDIIQKNIFECKNLSQIRDLLLPKLMSGKIRVQS